MNLTILHPGSKAIVTGINSPDIEGPERDLIARRLLELGFIVGTEVTFMHKAPLSGDPMSFLVRGMHVALRSEEARRVLVKKI